MKRLLAFVVSLGCCATCIHAQEPSRSQSDAYLILLVVVECVKEFNLDRAAIGVPVTSSEPQQIYIQRALAENVALKHCQKARTLLQPLLEVNDNEIKRLIESLDASFRGQERMHQHMLEVIDRVSSGRGHTSVSEIGKTGADAIEVLDNFIQAVSGLFLRLAGDLRIDERGLLARKISELFAEQNDVYATKDGQTKLPVEVSMVLQFRDLLLTKSGAEK